jgi:hypothetical protein
MLSVRSMPSWPLAARRPMSLTFRNLFRLLFGCISLQAIGLSPGNADVLVGLDLPRHISCRRGRQRSQGDKGTDKNGAKTSDGSPQPRPPACESGLKMEGEAVLSRKNTARTCLSWCHSCLSLCCPCPCCRHEKLVALGETPLPPCLTL